MKSLFRIAKSLDSECGINNVTLMDPTVFGIHVSIFLVASFPLLAALALLRSMRKLGPVSLVGTIAVVLAIIAVFYSSEQYPHVTSERITYDAIGYYAYGNTGRRAAIFAQVVTNLGIVVGYAIFVGKTLLSNRTCNRM